MALLDRDQVKGIVIDNLKVIADIPEGNIDNTSLAMLNDDQKKIFLSTLKKKINAFPYQLRNGSTSTSVYYDISLNGDTINSWNTVGDCINWITANQITVDKN